MHTPFGEILWELRRELGLTQREMAKEIGVSTGHLSNIENGKSPVSERLLERISAAYPDVPAGALREAAGEPGKARSPSPFGEFMRAARARLSEAPEDTAALLGVKPSRVAMVEQGYSPVPRRWIRPVARHYGASEEEVAALAREGPAAKRKGGASPLGEELRRLRREAGETRAAAAAALGIDASALTNITYGQRKVDDAFLALAASHYGTGMEALAAAAEAGGQRRPGERPAGTYGAYLKARRAAAGHSQKDLSGVLGIPVARIVDIERGRAMPPAWLEKALSRYYGRPCKGTEGPKAVLSLPEPTPFGGLMLNIRLDRGISASEMAEALGTDRAALNAVARGTSLVPDSWPGRLSELYNVSLKRAKALARKSESAPEIRRLSEVGKLLRKLRIERGESPDDMAARFGVGWAYVESVETGYTTMPPSWVPILEREYGISEREVLRRLGCGRYIRVADLNPFGECVEEAGLGPEALAPLIGEAPERMERAMRGYQIVPQRWFLKLARLRDAEGKPLFERKKLAKAIDRTNYSRRTYEKIKQEEASCRT